MADRRRRLAETWRRETWSKSLLPRHLRI